MATRLTLSVPSAKVKTKKLKDRFCGQPAHGVLPGIGGSRKHGPETNGISRCKRKRRLCYFAWSGICLPEDGLWRERMTRRLKISDLRIDEFYDLRIGHRAFFF